MERAKNRSLIFGFITTAVLGVLLHFFFEWANNNGFVGIFSAVNESTWEHLKLLYWPVFLFSIYEYLVYGKNHPQFWWSKLKGILIGMLLIIVLFYTYTGVLGFNIDFLNIAIFFIALIFTWITQKKALDNKTCSENLNKISLILLFGIGVLFIIFTFFTPTINLFRDPITNTYGI